MKKKFIKIREIDLKEKEKERERYFFYSLMIFIIILLIIIYNLLFGHFKGFDLCRMFGYS
jgi:disulfide bond formation protein DsbB